MKLSFRDANGIDIPYKEKTFVMSIGHQNFYKSNISSGDNVLPCILPFRSTTRHHDVAFKVFGITATFVVIELETVTFDDACTETLKKSECATTGGDVITIDLQNGDELVLSHGMGGVKNAREYLVTPEQIDPKISYLDDLKVYNGSEYKDCIAALIKDDRIKYSKHETVNYGANIARQNGDTFTFFYVLERNCDCATNFKISCISGTNINKIELELDEMVQIDFIKGGKNEYLITNFNDSFFINYHGNTSNSIKFYVSVPSEMKMLKPTLKYDAIIIGTERKRLNNYPKICEIKSIF
jgi:hypothetical protein